MKTNKQISLANNESNPIIALDILLSKEYARKYIEEDAVNTLVEGDKLSEDQEMALGL